MDTKTTITLPRGILIVFEGIDGTGKSTQLKLLRDYLKYKRYSVVTTKEPTEGTFGKKIRALYSNRGEVSREEELELFLLDRQEHVEKLIQPKLDEGKIILCDRYYLSTIAYQGAAGMNIEQITEKNSFAPEPDIALLFQLSPQQSITRIIKGRGDNLNDFEQEEYLKRVEIIFNSLTFPYIHHINANQTIERVQREIHTLIDTYLQKRVKDQ